MSLLEIAEKALAEITAREKHERGVSVAGVLKVFPGAKIVHTNQPALRCVHCGGAMSERLQQRRHVYVCGSCGKRRK